MLKTRFRFALLLAALALLPAAPAAAKDLLVFAAASLKNALDDIDAAYRKETGKAVVVSFAAKKNLIRPESRGNLLGNSIVLVAPAASTVTTRIGQDFPLASLLGDGHLAMANTESVPAGKYGKAALTNLGVWASVKDRVAQADNVRAALLLVAQGEAPLGIVYRTDAAAEPKVRIVDSFPDDGHPPIIYPVAVIAASANPDAEAYVAYLKSPAAAALFEKQGFTVLK